MVECLVDADHLLLVRGVFTSADGTERLETIDAARVNTLVVLDLVAVPAPSFTYAAVFKLLLHIFSIFNIELVIKFLQGWGINIIELR